MELQLTERMASIDATLAGFAKDVTRRFDEQGRTLGEIKTQVRETNGRVTELERENAVRAAVSRVSAREPSQVPVVASSVVTLGDFKWWLAIAVACFSAGAAFARLVGWS